MPARQQGQNARDGGNARTTEGTEKAKGSEKKASHGPNTAEAGQKRDTQRGKRTPAGMPARTRRRREERSSSGSAQAAGMPAGTQTQRHGGTTRGRCRAHVRGHPSKMVSGKVAVRVGVAGVSNAVAMESSLPGGMDPCGLAARGRSERRLGHAWSLASPSGKRVGVSVWWACVWAGPGGGQARTCGGGCAEGGPGACSSGCGSLALPSPVVGR